MTDHTYEQYPWLLSLHTHTHYSYLSMMAVCPPRCICSTCSQTALRSKIRFIYFPISSDHKRFIPQKTHTTRLSKPTNCALLGLEMRGRTCATLSRDDQLLTLLQRPRSVLPINSNSMAFSKGLHLSCHALRFAFPKETFKRWQQNPKHKKVMSSADTLMGQHPQVHSH